MANVSSSSNCLTSLVTGDDEQVDIGKPPYLPSRSYLHSHSHPSCPRTNITYLLIQTESTTEHESQDDRCSNTAATISGSHSWITSTTNNTNVITRFRTESLCSRGSDGAASAVSGMHSVGLGGLQPIISSASLASAGMLSSPGIHTYERWRDVTLLALFMEEY